MLEVNLLQAKEFLDRINNKDKVAVIHHDDTDGFASGILLYDWCIKKSANVEHFCFSVGDNKQEIIKQLEPFNKVLITDLAPKLIEEILNYIKNKEVLYIDHHQKDFEIPENILEYRTESRVSASKSVYTMIGGKEWLEIVCELADVGYSYPENKELIDNFSKKRRISSEEVKENFYFKIDLFLTYFFNNYSKAFEILDKIENYEELKDIYKYSDIVEKEVNKFTKEYEDKKEKLGFVNFYYFEPRFPIKSRVTTDISFNYPDETFVFVILWGKGVHISARNQSGKIDCVEILKKATQGLKGVNVGGHSKASGGYIQKEDLEKFKENLKKIKLHIK